MTSRENSTDKKGPHNRESVFLRSKNEPRFKRPLVDLEHVVQGTKESAQKLQKQRQDTFTALSKIACNPWDRYRKNFKINQAGPGWVIHTNDATFTEGIIKEVKTTKSELSRIITSHHKNFVDLREAIYYEGAVFLIYEIMDVSLAQVFSSPLGRLQLFEVAAFARELLTGIEYMHINLKITHGALSSNSVLLSVTGAVKIGMFVTKAVGKSETKRFQRT
ncbi:Serine/threonine-protein kinase bur1 [Penicillium digitatum PHI26]|uniref:Serine/threonine-protein kinase bur1 n=2 Tax=Penicillium digitatum TaxID=36651 RepID=K9GD66_PEND2|nr:Serine/threonine-protein kinase bur1 [Penicillium digitatum Pd1]EKV19137.1 Serine/threonine-protein kinase bur1 [Penicillium digitatum PHI26]EKV20980.1 Serine/threonine-protein kinase bur1 [Penicillium digitatum Pd1]